MRLYLPVRFHGGVESIKVIQRHVWPVDLSIVGIHARPRVGPSRLFSALQDDLLLRTVDGQLRLHLSETRSLDGSFSIVDATPTDARLFRVPADQPWSIERIPAADYALDLLFEAEAPIEDLTTRLTTARVAATVLITGAETPETQLAGDMLWDALKIR
jgi:hypothetical protein